MGRTSKYKKIKSFDPFSKQNGGRVNYENVGVWGFGSNGVKPKKRSRTSEKLRQEKLNRRLKRQKQQRGIMSTSNSAELFDRPPSDNEDEFDLADLSGSIKKQKVDPASFLLEDKEKESLPTVKLSGTGDTSPENDRHIASHGTIDKREIKEASCLLKLSHHGDDKVENKSILERKENESKRAYNKRVREETRQIIKKQKMDEINPGKRQRKKEFLNQKKKRKRNGNNGDAGCCGDNDYDEYNDCARRDEVKFGEQAERPPMFKSLPRGASHKKELDKKSKKSMKSDKEVQAERENLEKMRRKVQEQYAVIKAKRKQAGDFHL